MIKRFTAALLLALVSGSAFAAQTNTNQSSAPEITGNTPGIAQIKAPLRGDAFEVGEIEGSTGISVPLKVILPKNLPGKAAYLTFDGFDKELEFSRGKKLAGSWLVRLNEAHELTIRAPANKPQLFLMEVTLTAEDSAPLETRLIRVDLRQRPAPPARKQTFANLFAGLWQKDRPTVSRLGGTFANAGKSQDRQISPGVEGTVQKNLQPDTTPQPGTSVTVRDVAPEIIALAKPQDTTTPNTAPKAKPAKRSAEELRAFASLFKKARTLMEAGDIAAARLIYEHLASAGDAQSALAMARTFEETVLKRYSIYAMSADPEQAGLWYERAAELGSAEARKILTAAAR